MLPVYYPAWTYSRLCLFTRNPIGKHVLKITQKIKFTRFMSLTTF